MSAAAGMAAFAGTRLGLAQETGAQPELGESDVAALIAGAAEPLPPIDDPAFARFVDRFAEARLVLLGEESHGTDEFYRARAAMTRRLVQEHGFNIVALEADWPEAARMDAFVRGHDELPDLPSQFIRFPGWMWRNEAVADFLEELRAVNSAIDAPERRAGIYGLDLYSLPSSMDAVVGFLDRHNAEAAARAREAYGCLSPWIHRPEDYGALALSEAVDTCAEDVFSVISDVLGRRLDFIEASDIAYFNALNNARVVAAAEAYYRAMYEGSVASWNLRDTHMFETLEAVLSARGDTSKAVVWAHNSHIGDASATEMGERGEINIGQLARKRFGERAVLIGFSTDRGTVTAASDWNGRQETKTVRPSMAGSVGEVLRDTGRDRFLLDLRNAPEAVRAALAPERLERFIGVIYLPETERWSHYAGASLPNQFDAVVWLEETTAVQPLSLAEMQALPESHPFHIAS